MSETTEQAVAEGAVETQEELGLLDAIIDEGRIGRDDEQRDQSRRQIATLVDEVMQGQMSVSKDIEATINARIADIDALITQQLNAIMHAPEFQQLEGSWRGLSYLVQQTETSTSLKLRVLNVDKKDAQTFVIVRNDNAQKGERMIYYRVTLTPCDDQDGKLKPLKTDPAIRNGGRPA